MLAPVRFDLPDGRSVQPMHIPPWANENRSPDLPPILRGLRGEWPCVPFGAGTASADNPIALQGTPTSHSFQAGKVFDTRYRIAVTPLT
jgi:hypothetical protein